MSVWNRASADGLGTALLLAAVVGSGIMGERLSQGNDAIALLANSLATGFALAALIITFGPRSGAHFNPVVTVALAIRRDIPWRDVGPYLTLQFTGALIGVAAAHMMFDLPIIQYSIKARSSWGCGGARSSRHLDWCSWFYLAMPSGLGQHRLPLPDTLLRLTGSRHLHPLLTLPSPWRVGSLTPSQESTLATRCRSWRHRSWEPG